MSNLCKFLTVILGAFVLVATISLLDATSRGMLIRPALSNSEKWVSLEEFRTENFFDVLPPAERNLILYFIDTVSQQGVRYALASNGIEFDGRSHAESYLCLISGEGDLGNALPAGCRSSTRNYDFERLEVLSDPLFQDNIPVDQIDASKVLRNGANPQLREIYAPYSRAQFDSTFLKSQRLGDGDLAAMCSGLQKTSGDNIGAVGVYRTRTRPHYKALMAAGVGDADPVTSREFTIHLKLAQGQGYLCDVAAVLPSDTLIILSGRSLLAIDLAKRRFARWQLPVQPLDAAILRVEP